MPSFAPRRFGFQEACQPRRTRTVVVADPRPDDYTGWTSTAGNSGVRLHFVATAEEALRLARSTTVDLWVINAQLSDRPGCELCEMLRASSPSTSFYLVTETYSPESERATLRARATLFGCKGSHVTWLRDWLDRAHRFGRSKPHEEIQQPRATKKSRAIPR